MKTFQLRHYDIEQGAMEEFVDWFRGPLVVARAAYGFQVESAFVDATASTFTWVVSFTGSEAEFLAAEKVYDASVERAGAFETYPGTISAKRASIVKLVAF
jgi:hypothetical protein